VHGNNESKEGKARQVGSYKTLAALRVASLLNCIPVSRHALLQKEQ
jgi:hypothetical protein